MVSKPSNEIPMFWESTLVMYQRVPLTGSMSPKGGLAYANDMKSAIAALEYVQIVLIYHLGLVKVYLWTCPDGLNPFFSSLDLTQV